MSLEMKYFVLKPKSKTADDKFAQAARKAMRVYANHIESVDSELAHSLRFWANQEFENELTLKSADNHANSGDNEDEATTQEKATDFINNYSTQF